MKRRSAALATTPGAESETPTPAHWAAAIAARPIEGDSASTEALLRLHAAVVDHREQVLKPLLQDALTQMHADRPHEGAEAALRALELDEENGWGWYILAICREKAGAFTQALQCYERALEIMPDNDVLPNDLGRLAARMDMPVIAEKLFSHFLTRHPDSLEGANNLACAVRNQARFDEAIEILRPYIHAYPESPLLWNTLGSIVYDQGRMPEALTFFDEALRVDPGFMKARYNRASAHLALGDAQQALRDLDGALAEVVLPQEAAMMRLARSTTLLTAGEIGQGWDAYEARFDPDWEGVAHTVVDRPRWEPGQDLQGKRLLVFGEQGLGDEVLFANIMPDVIEAVGGEELLTIAVERRLIPLYQQSFPKAQVVRHWTYRVDHHLITVTRDVDLDAIDHWTPIASMLRTFRRSVEEFPSSGQGYLKADPDRVAHWRDVLAAQGPGAKIGILWKSLKMTADRSRHFSPFDAWKPVLTTPGATLVNMQYGECAAELAEARERFGVEIFNPPGIDLKNDLADVAALCCALDVTVGPANATSNIAAACGAPAWFIVTPDGWPRLGTDRYPWYPQARAFEAQYGGWGQAMERVGQALREAFPAA